MERMILKQTNKYKKGLKWHLVELTASGGKVSSWFKTKKDAEYAKERSRNIVGKYTTNNRILIPGRG